ncbi:MAG: selenium metabolism-associated LysR family transcriptional regulator [Planctomycetota bacterium]|nr:selenium metabolism-associated LysR family transcriptional regulator [Planctomycetota bacterium]
MAHTDPLSIRQLEVFVALVDQGSFTQAARHMGLSQSTVSGHIADLEKRLGVRLVGRERSGVTPTGAGEILLRPARDALRAERNARMAAAELTGLLRGTLALGGSTIPAVYILPSLLRSFREQHAGITVNLLTGDSTEVVEMVRQGDVDAAITGFKPRARGLRVERADGDELVLIAPPEHPFASSKAVDVADVLTQAMVLREEGSGTRLAMLEALGMKHNERELNVVCHVGSTEAVKACVRAGLGISFVSNLAIEDEVKAGTLAVVPVKGVSTRRDFWIVAREEDDISPAGRAFWEVTLGA